MSKRECSGCKFWTSQMPEEKWSYGECAFPVLDIPTVKQRFGFSASNNGERCPVWKPMRRAWWRPSSWRSKENSE